MSDPAMNARARAILWLDSIGAVAVGILVLSLRAWLAPLLGFSVGLVTFLGGMNLVYGAYSGPLAFRASRGRDPSRFAVDFLVVANLAWAMVCASIALLNGRGASVFGIGHVALEGLYVGSLALVERRYVRPFTR